MYMWLAITLLAAFGVFAPYIFDMDGFNGGYALAFLSLVLAITGLFVTIMYRGRARMLDAIVSGQNLLAHWTYSTEEWQSYTEKADKMERADKWALFRLVAIISIVVGIGFWLFHRESGFFAVFFIVGLLALLAVVVLITTSYDHWQNRRYHGEVYLAREGALVNRQVHLWQGWGATLEGVGYREKDSILEITYSTPGRSNRNDYTLRVAVPAGQEQTARMVRAELGKSSIMKSNNI
jgi:hypothetical protein